jgi:DNA helicase II / ATP-dependent DNA helicase PcrA
MRFTKEQSMAISHAHGNLQLIACAGSGKTEVVARRVATLLKNGASPGSVIAFTFTDKAAGELKDRIVTRCRELLGDVVGLAEMYVGTIHAFCLDLLMTEVHEVLKFNVLNEVQQTLFIDRHSKESGLTTCRDLKGNTLKRYLDTRHYLSALNTLREDEADQALLKKTSLPSALSTYRDLLNKKRYLDYSEILTRALVELRTNTSLRKHLSQRVRYLIVDEYQDVNPIQEAVIKELHALGAEVCVVGDDDQTIYQWRGSEVENILSFERRYTNVTQVRLEDNFRSSEGVIETARVFIEQNVARLSKKMKAAKTQDFEPGDICALQFDDSEAEAEYIAETARSLHGVAFKEPTENDPAHHRGLAWSDMAILLRSVSRNAAPITAALARKGIRHVVVGMNTLFETAEAQAARELFYLLGGSSGTTRKSVLDAWKAAALGISDADLQRAVAEAEAAKFAMENPRERYGFYSIQRSFARFVETAGVREEKVPDDRGEIVFYNLGKFSQLISDFETIHYHSQPKEKYKSFGDFLQYHAKDAYPEGWQSNQYANPDAVRIMTVHQAKGMQWPVVFVPALIKNRFPSPAMGGRPQGHIMPAAGSSNQDRYRGSIEDERRLFYVAMTRSQKFLHLTYAPVAGNQRFQQVSEFLIDIYASKFVKRRAPDYTSRRRLSPEPRRGITNVVFSFSDLKYFFECPYQFKLRILYGFNAPIHEALGYGRSLHNALAEVHRRALDADFVSPTDAKILTERHLHAPYAYRALKEKLEQAATRVIADYIRDNDLKNIEFSEKQIEINLDEGVTVVGRVDLVRRIDTGETTIVDLKSSDRAQPEDVTETQLHIYALGYRELTGRDADQVEIYELDERKKKSRSVDQDFITEVKRDVREAAVALRSGSLAPKPKPKKCVACDYLRMCSVGLKTVQGDLHL